MRLTQRLGLVIAVAVAPIVAIEVYNAYSLIEQERAKTHRIALEYQRHASWEMQRMLAGVRGVMRTVALSPIVRARDWGSCERFVEDVTAELPQLTSLAIADESGLVRCGRGSKAGVSVADRGYFQEALGGTDFVIGGYTVGRSSGRPVLPLAMPVDMPNGGAREVVISSIDLAWLTDGLAERGVPPQGSITIADRTGTIIARQPLPKEFIGTRIPDPFLYLLNEPTEGTIELTSQDGTKRILGYKPLMASPQGIYISAGVGVDYSYSGIYAATVRALVVVALAVLAAILASTIISRRFIAGPMARLAATAERWRSGDLKAKSDVRGDDEFGTLGEVLDQAIEQARRREERITLLMREVTHRVKNQMAVMLSMARHVGRNSATVGEFQKAFSDRIMAMSRSHDLVFVGGEEARLAVLMLSQIEPFAVGPRISLSGPEVWINAQSAQHLGMAIHELATNAVKYGAWSNPAGQVEVTWSIVEGDPQALRIVWKEHGGPGVLPRASMGFGSTVLESVVGPALGGWSELTFEASGVRWTCEFTGHFSAKPPTEVKAA
jgi:two-component sensor histidine kinase